MLHTRSKTSAIGSPHVSHLLLRIDYYSNINERCRRFENSSVWIKTQIADVKWCIHYAPRNSLLFHDNIKRISIFYLCVIVTLQDIYSIPYSFLLDLGVMYFNILLYGKYFIILSILYY